MIRVERKVLRDYFTRGGDQLLNEAQVSFFDKRRHLISPGVAATLLLLGLAIGSLSSRTSLVLFLTTIGVLAFLYVKLRLTAHRLLIRRIVPKKSLRELDQVEVIVEIKNRSDFAVTGLVIDDLFPASKNTQVHVAPGRIASRSMTRVSYRRSCDGGMGRHAIGPLVAKVTDELGIFEFRVVEDESIMLEIYPKVESVPVLPVRPSIEATRYGNYEVASRGLSVNFSGVRPYERGDSLRHIAWKLSTRGQGLLVKEFEKVVNCDVNIVLNMSPHWQIGRHSNSTWEYGKDIALSIIQQQLDLGNTVAFFSDRSFVEPGAGADHFHYLARHIAELNPVRDEDSYLAKPSSILPKYRDFYGRGSNIYYVTPYNNSEFEVSRPWLKNLKAEGFNIVVVLIDTNTFWLQFIESISTGLLIGASLMQGLDEAAQDLERSGITTYIAQNKRTLQDVFRAHRGVV